MTGEPQFMAVPSKDPDFQGTIHKAQETLAEFRGLLAAREPGTVASLKTTIEDGDNRAFLWLAVESVKDHCFVASVFEIPAEFTNYHVGDQLQVADADVMDWMIIEKGVLCGGYSLRYQRSKLPANERTAFDEYIGVMRYA